MTKTLTALALILTLSACGGSSHGEKTTRSTSVQPITQADLHRVVMVICAEPTAGIETIIAGIQAQSVARMRRVLEEMARTCPDRMQDFHDYLERLSGG